MALRVLLWALGVLMASAGRRSDRFRRQLTRDVILEIVSDDGVARHYTVRNRRVISRSGRTNNSDCTLRFATATQGFSTLIARNANARMIEGLLDGSIRIEGRMPLLLWFQGLIQRVAPAAPALRLPATPPDAYRTPSSSPEVSRFITREPAVSELDPEWTHAIAARRKLQMIRAAAGEPIPPF